MSKLKDLIRNETIQSFKDQDFAGPYGNQKRQISIRPDAVTLTKIDTLADFLDMSRQGLLDDILENGIADAIDAYCEAHGPEHSDEAHKGFVQAFTKRWEEQNSQEGDK